MAPDRRQEAWHRRLGRTRDNLCARVDGLGGGEQQQEHGWLLAGRGARGAGGAVRRKVRGAEPVARCVASESV